MGGNVDVQYNGSFKEHNKMADLVKMDFVPNVFGRDLGQDFGLTGWPMRVP